MNGKPALDDPEIAHIAWTRFRRMMGWMALGGIFCVGLAETVLYLWTGPMPIHMMIATALGVWFTFMLGTGLMALIFLSSGTGHDEQVQDRMKGMIDLDD